MLINQDKRRFVFGTQDNIKRDPKQFWDYVRIKRGSGKIPAVMRGNASSL